MNRATTNEEANDAGSAERVSTRHMRVSPFPDMLLPHLQDTLELIVEGALAKTCCLGAIIATVEPDHTLCARATAGVLDAAHLAQLAEATALPFVMPAPLATLNKGNDRHNLAVRAVQTTAKHARALISDRLYDLFRPAWTSDAAAALQKEAGIAQILAIPFFVDETVAGCLFAATQSEVQPHELHLLEVLAQQAGAALQSQRFVADMDTLEQLTLALQYNSTDEETILKTAVNSLVDTLDYAAALALTQSDTHELLVRAGALHLTPQAAAQLEPLLTGLVESEQALARLDEPAHEQNLAVRALRRKRNAELEPVESDHLYDLLCPQLSKRAAARAQKAAHVQRLSAIPFALANELSGCLVVMSYRPHFSARERRLLTAVAQQMALGIRNARLYWRVEEQRRVAQTFARMAFSASAYLHTLRNQIGAFRTYVGLVQLLPQMKPEQQQEVIASSYKAYHTLDQAADILDHLHEPWRQHPDIATDVNDCLTTALLKIFPKLNLQPGQERFTTSKGINIHLSRGKQLRPIYTSPEMLTEAFRIVIRNAVDALQEKDAENGERNIWLKSEAGRVGYVEVWIRDDGIGISPANVRRIFELGWSTKQGRGMGFGLFWARNFIEGLGGRIDVESSPQHGATFRFWLPTLPAD